jgi:hypothetical protein
MDYTSNLSLFICYLRSYIAKSTEANLRDFFRGSRCLEYTRITTLLLNSMQVLLLLEKQKEALLLQDADAPVSYLDGQAAVVISYCLTLMDTVWVAENPYGIEVDSFDHCGPAVVVRRVRSANNKLVSANEKYISSGQPVVS